MRFSEFENNDAGTGYESDPALVKCEFCNAHASMYNMNAEIRCDFHPKCSRKARYRVEFADGTVENHASLQNIKSPIGNATYAIITSISNGSHKSSEEKYGIKYIATYNYDGSYRIPRYVRPDNDPSKSLPRLKCEHCGKSVTLLQYGNNHGDSCIHNPDYQPTMKWRVIYVDNTRKEFATLLDVTNDHVYRVAPLTKKTASLIHIGKISGTKYGIHSIKKI